MQENTLDITTQKIYIGVNSDAIIVCSQCGTHKSFTPSPMKHYGKTLTIKCRCGFIFKVFIEPRKSYRKPTKLSGLCYKNNSNALLTKISIIDIAKNGIGFTMEAKTPETDIIKKGDILYIEFKLDNKNKSLIRTKVIVRVVNNANVGAEFHYPDANTLKEIGFYILP